MSGIWGGYEEPEATNEEVIPAEIVKLFIMKAMQPDALRTPLSLPSKPSHNSVKIEDSDSETLGLEMDDKVIHSIKLIQHAKEMSQLIEAAKEQIDLMADTQIQTFPPALDIPVHPTKPPKHRLNHPIQYMDKEYSDFTLGKGPKIPEITTKTAKRLLKKSTAALLAHAGYQNAKESVLNTLTDVVEEYIIKMTSLLRVSVDQGANFGATGFPKMEEQDDVPEIHFPALGEEGVDELQPSLEPGFQMLHSLEQEAQLQTIETQEEDCNTITDSPSQEVSAEVLQTHFLSKRRRRL